MAALDRLLSVLDSLESKPSMALTSATSLAGATSGALPPSSVSSASDQLGAAVPKSSAEAYSGIKRGRVEEELLSVLLPPPCPWTKYFDPATHRHYFYNQYTGVTQWEVPADYKEPDVSSSSSSGASGATDASSISYTASFNTRTGSIETVGGGTYWDKVGRANDRETRQLGAFMDPNELQANREQAKLIKAQLQKSGINWRKYKEEKKIKLKTKKAAWLYEDDD